MKTVYIIFNPLSGKKNDSLAALVKEELIEKGFQAENIKLVTPHSAEEAFLKAKEISQNKIDLVIPLGGDGTINKIIGGVYEGGAFTKIGLIPSGTVNNFAKALDIPLSMKQAIDVIANGKEKKVDICKVNGQYMISSLTLGLLADIAADVTPQAKRRFGPFAFLKDAIRILKRNRTYSLVVEIGDKTITTTTKFLLVTMSNTIAGFPSFSPNALVDDGLMQVYTMKQIHFLKFLFHINAFRRGDFSKAEEISHFQTHQLTIRPANRKKFSRARTRIDGDKSDYIPVSMSVLKKAITVIVP